MELSPSIKTVYSDMKDLKANIENSKEMAEAAGKHLTPIAETQILLENQIAIMEALQDIQEKMTRMEGRTSNFKAR